MLQECWQKMRTAEGWNTGAGDDGASVLKVIGHAAARFPANEAASLCADLLKVRTHSLHTPATEIHNAALEWAQDNTCERPEKGRYQGG